MRLIVVICLLLSPLFASPKEDRHDILYTNLAGAAIITAWGVANWDYGTVAPRAHNEGWSGKHTAYGGADKAGHLYSSYLVGSLLSGLYESWGYERDDAALYGAASSFFLMNFMEAGDSFSRTQGFSYEDFVMNSVGALSAYLFSTYPDLSRRFDLRIEYVPSFKTADFITEYEKMKYLIAIKADGFESITNPLLKYVEFHLGYYTRHYENGFNAQSERFVYAGIGINLSKIASENGYPKTGRFLNYYQIPYTYIPWERELNR